MQSWQMQLHRPSRSLWLRKACPGQGVLPQKLQVTSFSPSSSFPAGNFHYDSSFRVQRKEKSHRQLKLWELRMNLKQISDRFLPIYEQKSTSRMIKGAALGGLGPKLPLRAHRHAVNRTSRQKQQITWRRG
jgi:hypothetical protein